MKNGFRMFVWMLVALAVTAACSTNAVEAPSNLPQGPALVMFYTEGGLPGQAMFPIVDGIEAEFTGQVAVIRLNAVGTELTEMMNGYGVRGHPSFVVLDGNNEVTQRFTGPQTEEGLREALTVVSQGHSRGWVRKWNG